MWWKLSRRFSKNHYAGNKRDQEDHPGRAEPGIWLANGSRSAGVLSGRETYPSLERSIVLHRVDDSPVWSVTCFYVRAAIAREGLAGQLKAAIQFARQRSARSLKGIRSIQVAKRRTAFRSLLAPSFVEAGFVETERPNANASHHALLPQMMDEFTNIRNTASNIDQKQVVYFPALLFLKSSRQICYGQ
jgi:hypothetical protein